MYTVGCTYQRSALLGGKSGNVADDGPAWSWNGHCHGGKMSGDPIDGEIGF